MIVVATGFIPLSPSSIVSAIVMWDRSQWLEKNIVRSPSKNNSRKAWIGALASAIQMVLKTTSNTVQSLENIKMIVQVFHKTLHADFIDGTHSLTNNNKCFHRICNSWQAWTIFVGTMPMFTCYNVIKSGKRHG